jgi:hypothetical protein
MTKDPTLFFFECYVGELFKKKSWTTIEDLYQLKVV